MERIYAFIDEYGQFGWDLGKPDVSSSFIITAIIVKECDLTKYTKGAEEIRQRFFQTGEIKSSKVANDSNRRKRILSELSKLPFKIFTIVINKQEYLDNVNIQGLQYKRTFYKYMNNIVHRELRLAFDTLTIMADEIGTNDYMASFCRYVEKRQDAANLFGEAKFMFRKSNNDVRIQVADFICGSLGRVYDIKKCDGFGQAYFQIIEPQVIRIEQYPKLYSNFSFDTSAIASGYDKEIAKLCYSRAVTYIQNAAINDDYSKARVIVLKYLLFKFMNYDENGYISTRELILQLEHTELKDISNQTFRSKIIGKMRDEKIIIASSSKGYKIPSKMSEIKDYVYHDARVVMPMLDRLNNCRNLVKLNTLNNVDLLDGTSFERLKWYFDNYPSEVKNTAK